MKRLILYLVVLATTLLLSVGASSFLLKYDQSNYKYYLIYLLGVNIAGIFDFGASIYVVKKKIEPERYAFNLREIQAAIIIMSACMSVLIISVSPVLYWLGYLDFTFFVLGLATGPYYAVINSAQKIYEMAGRKRASLVLAARGGLYGNSIITLYVVIFVHYNILSNYLVYVLATLVRVAFIHKRFLRIHAFESNNKIKILKVMVPLAMSQQLNSLFAVYENLPRILLFKYGNLTELAIISAHDMYLKFGQSFSVFWRLINLYTKGRLYEGYWGLIFFFPLGLVVATISVSWIAFLRSDFLYYDLYFLSMPLLFFYFMNKFIFERMVISSPRVLFLFIVLALISLWLINLAGVRYEFYGTVPFLMLVMWFIYENLLRR